MKHSIIVHQGECTQQPKRIRMSRQPNYSFQRFLDLTSDGSDTYEENCAKGNKLVDTHVLLWYRFSHGAKGHERTENTARSHRVFLGC
jgi:hypothetical protein